MLRIYHPQIPTKLLANQLSWTADLLNLVKRYQSYSKIPKNELDKVLKYYKDAAFVDDIYKLSNRKCTFCESEIETVSYINVEHFHPKSIYPATTFWWKNLIPACGACNSVKGDFDTKNEPFVNPMKDDPDQYFEFTDCRIKVSNSAPSVIKAENTIKMCNLKRISLTTSYARIVPSIYEVSDKIEIELNKYSLLSQVSAKLKCLFRILDSVKNLITISRPGELYAGFVRSMLRKDEVIKKAINLINTNVSNLGLSSPLHL